MSRSIPTDGATKGLRPPGAAQQEFEQVAEPFRRELRVHCYRMLGSVHDAEDLVQETYLRAWRSFESFDRSGAMRAWLYRIATNACLNALESRKRERRLMPHQVGPASGVGPPGAPATDVPWLEPLPFPQSAQPADPVPTPESRYVTRESVRLAFVAALQVLPSRQRAMLLLCDVLDWSAAEVAALLGVTVASVNSALQRARETLSRNDPGDRTEPSGSIDGAQSALLSRYMAAWETHDVGALAMLLKEDATAVMPPWREWFAGREAIGSFFRMAWTSCRGLALLPITANGQPGFAAYEYSGSGDEWAANALHVLTLDGDRIAAMSLFVEPRLFADFGMPALIHRPPPLRGVPMS